MCPGRARRAAVPPIAEEDGALPLKQPRKIKGGSPCPLRRAPHAGASAAGRAFNNALVSPPGLQLPALPSAPRAEQGSRLPTSAEMLRRRRPRFPAFAAYLYFVIIIWLINQKCTLSFAERWGSSWQREAFFVCFDGA